MESLDPDAEPILCITGATGFVGSHLLADLADRGAHELRCMTRHGLPAAAEHPRVTETRGSLLEADAAGSFIVPGSVVVNFAYAADADAATNLAMADNLARACRAAPAGHLIHCSTATVAGRPASDTVDESVLCRPVTEYQKTKLEIERLLQRRLDGYCPMTIVRPTAVFGRGGRNLSATVDHVMRRPWPLNLLQALLFADRRLHLVCVENVIAAIRFILSHRATLDGEVFIVSDDDAVENNYRDVLNLVADEVDGRGVPAWSPPFGRVMCSSTLRLAGRPDPNPRRIYSPRKLRQRGFRPALELAEGVRRFARWHAGGRRR